MKRYFWPAASIVAGLILGLGAVLWTATKEQVASVESAAPAAARRMEAQGSSGGSDAISYNLSSGRASASSAVLDTPTRSSANGVLSGVMGGAAHAPAVLDETVSSRQEVTSKASAHLPAETSTRQNRVSTSGAANASVSVLSPPAVAVYSDPSAAAAPAAEDPGISIAVPAGARAPIVFYDNVSRPAPQNAALDRIASDFQEVVSASPPPGMSQEIYWDEARKLADHRYEALYGFDAYNQLSMHAAREALAEKELLKQRFGTP